VEIVFFGDFTEFTAAHLRACLAAGHRVNAFVAAATVHRRHRRRERPLDLLAPRWSVSQLRRSGIPLLVTRTPIDADGLATELAPRGGTVLVSVGFNGRIPAAIRARYPAGAINVHPALLPDYRGPHPVHAMVLDGTLEEYAGITIHSMTDGFDEGPILPKPCDYDREISRS